MAWRVARSLEKLRDQIDAASPNRNKASDGTIGDADHQNRESDHNPWCGPGVVTAIDITHDPAKGVDIDKLTDDLQRSRDPRIKYVIANRLIMSGAGGPSPWVWRAYYGSNPHTAHFHLSVNCNASKDDTRRWELPSLRGIGGSQPVEPTPREDENMPSAEEIARATVNEFLDRDIFKLPFENPDNQHLRFKWFMEFIAGQVHGARRGVNALPTIIKHSTSSPQQFAEALRPVIKDVVGPVVREAVKNAMGADNEAQADAIVDEITARLIEGETA